MLPPNYINHRAAYAYLREFLKLKNIITDLKPFILEEELALGFNANMGTPLQIYSRTLGYEGDVASYKGLIDYLNSLFEIVQKNFEDNTDYQTLYTKLHELAAALPIIMLQHTTPSLYYEKWQTFHDAFFIQLYENNAEIANFIYELLIAKPNASAVSNNSNQSRELGSHHHIMTRLRESGIHQPGMTEISHPEHPFNRFFSGTLGYGYNPLVGTNKPYVVSKTHHGVTILRLGMQIKRDIQPQPAFINYLASKSRKHPGKPYHHIYFNLLKVEEGDFERNIERERTIAIEKHYQHNLGVAIITLPADNTFFLQCFDMERGSAKEKAAFEIEALKRNLIKAIIEGQHEFKIPDEIKPEVFRGGDYKVLEMLFNHAVYEILGEQQQSEIDAAQRQAILFEFVKYQLSNYMITALNPDTVNFTCKDGIDRGGVHTLWYDFRQRIESGQSMSEQEFRAQMDVPALLVKNRPMNHHRNLLWNALKHAYIAHPEKYETMLWVKDWLVENRPSGVLAQELEEQLSFPTLGKRKYPSYTPASANTLGQSSQAAPKETDDASEHGMQFKKK